MTVRRFRGRRFARRLGLGGALLCFASATGSEARETSRRLQVEVEVDPCTGVASDVVGRILTVELGAAVTSVAPGESSDPAQKPDVTQVALSCEDGTIRMVVRDPLTGKTLERHIDLRAERSSARPRLLGLSAAELVAASWIELESSPPPAPVVEATAPAAARPEAAAIARAVLQRPEPVHWDVEAIAVARRFPDADLLTWGAGVAGTWAYQGWLALGADLVGETGSGKLTHDRSTVGDVSVRTGSLGLFARLRREWPTLALEAGFGARLALTRLRANAEQAQPGLWQEHVFSGTWGGPLVEVRVGWKPSRLVLLVASVEGGTVTRQLAGLVARQPEILISGPWAAISLGVGIGSDGPALAR